MQHHLDYLLLHAREDKNEEFINDHHELFLEVADELMEASLHQNALSFYQWVKRAHGQATASVYIKMAKCFQASGLEFKAEECLQTALQIDEDNIEARVELAQIYEASNQKAPAATLIKEAMDIEARNKAPAAPTRKYRKRDRDKKEKAENGAAAESSPPKLDPLTDQSFLTTKRPKTSYKPRQPLEPADLSKERNSTALGLQGSYSALRTEHEKMIAGDAASTRRWMEAAQTLTSEFRGFKPFYPSEKYFRFTGYTGDHAEHAKTPIDSGLVEMADRLSQSMFYSFSVIERH